MSDTGAFSLSAFAAAAGSGNPPGSSDAGAFDSYNGEAAAAGAWDEMFEGPGKPREAYEGVFAALQPLKRSEMRFQAEHLARVFTERGVTFSLGGEERPFPLDLIPRIVDAHEWEVLRKGVAQRVRALEAFLADVYDGEGSIFDDGVVPRRLVTTSSHFHREAVGFSPPNGVRVHVAGIDVVRDENGRFVVLEDNVRIPSGVSYVIENRRAMTQTMPGLFADQRVHPVDGYPEQLLRALKAAAPHGVKDPVVAVLTPGVFNSAYFEHALLARLMGVELVEGRDLVVSGNEVRMRTTSGEEPVHVIYRRVDDEFLDPLHFRADSVIGCPGIMNAARAGMVTLANAVGNGIADDKLVYTYVPDMIDYYLSEKPILDNVETHRLDDREVLADVVEHLDELVVKPTDGSGGKGIVIGPRASERELVRLRRQIEHDPRGWIAQRPVMLSTSPTFVGDGPAPRHIDLRPFAVHDGNEVWLLPGGLTRVALPEGQLVVNSSQGGGSKDTWVLADAADNGVPAVLPTAAEFIPPAGRSAHAGGEREPGPAAAMHQQQQQQQQSRRRRDASC